MSKTCKGTAKRLIKCFCGCSELTEDEVQRIYRLSAQATLIDRQANQILHKFLEKERSGDKGEAEQFLDVYEKCDVLLHEYSILTLDELDDLVECGLPYHLEKELKLQIQTGDKLNIERCLFRIQSESRHELEASDDYKNYKQAILDKLRKGI